MTTIKELIDEKEGSCGEPDGDCISEIEGDCIIPINTGRLPNCPYFKKEVWRLKILRGSTPWDPRTGLK
jgi:hypothetical protein